jgi:phage portal protein BeeE
MKLGDLLPRFLKPRNSYSDLEERAFSDRLRQANVSGQVVTEHSALWQSAVWGCVRVISETLARE